MCLVASVMTKHQVRWPHDRILPPPLELYWYVSIYVVDNFNCAFGEGSLSISQRLGIILLTPNKNKSLEHLKNWRP